MYSIREKIRRILRSACPLCGLVAVAGDLCPPCEAEVMFVFDASRHCHRCLYQAPITRACSRPESQPWCSTCRQRPLTYARAVAGIHVAVPGDQLMRRFKARGDLAHAGLFARLLWRNMQSACPDLPQLAALIPIPSSREAILKRGMNPAAEIARELASMSGVPLRGAWLRRTREEFSQKNLDWRARQQSVSGLYEGHVPIKGCWLGLIDDVLTTGNTLEAASAALLRAGARGVVALVAARTLAK